MKGLTCGGGKKKGDLGKKKKNLQQNKKKEKGVERGHGRCRQRRKKKKDLVSRGTTGEGKRKKTWERGLNRFLCKHKVMMQKGTKALCWTKQRKKTLTTRDKCGMGGEKKKRLKKRGGGGNVNAKTKRKTGQQCPEGKAYRGGGWDLGRRDFDGKVGNSKNTIPGIRAMNNFQALQGGGRKKKKGNAERGGEKGGL